ncbi:MAG TPA: hypothetical protein VLT58_13355 [Polyangia bacterium]|nr:hypothetical protein [Polyangia bacterium]
MDAAEGTEVSEVTLPLGGQANDNAWTERPTVRAPRRRKDETYARWENLILPMRFAVRMTGWQTGG